MSVYSNLAAVGRKLVGVKPSGHGPFHEADSGWVDAKPYSQVYSNGVFEGYDNSLWKYFAFPLDVKTEWNKNPMETMYAQNFFVDIVDRAAASLANYTDNARADIRRNFHLQITADDFQGIVPPASATPSHRDFLSRMSSRYRKPVWNGYMGLRLNPSQSFAEAYGWRAKVERYMEMMRDADQLQMHLYAQDMTEITSMMLDAGFRPLDFSTREGRKDMERITAWHGISDDSFLLPQELETTRMSEPIHGYSIITPRWGEIGMYAIKPLDDLFLVDPISEAAKWAKPIYSGDGDVVVVNIRGEIRSPRVAENMFDSKRLIRESATERSVGKSGTSRSDAEKSARSMSQLDRARAASANGHGLLDNVEIIVGTRITDQPNPLRKLMNAYSLDVVPIPGRQPDAINSTFPTYPKPIFNVKRGNSTRSPLANEMYGGVLAMSGLFRNTKTAASNGILVGLTDGTSEYNEVFTDVEGANKRHKTPGWLITGRPGAGKTQQMLMCMVQCCYLGYRTVYLNPKKTGTLKPAFDRVDGITINMSSKYLGENPGMMDPVFFIEDRTEVAQILNQAIQMATQMNAETGLSSSNIKSRLAAELTDSAQDLRNKCSGHIIFGNPDAGTKGISDQGVRENIANKMVASPFWKAFISMAPSTMGDMLSLMKSGKPLLIEWDKSLSPPSQADVENGKMTDAQMDSIISINIAFRYSVEIAGAGRNGGAILIDEAWVLKSSRESMSLVEGGLREYREANIMMVLGTQRLQDFMDGESDMTTFFDRFLIMAISANDKGELDRYFQLTGLPRTEANRRYIVEAGVESDEEDSGKRRRVREIPRAYYIDRIYNFEGGVICGPWPLEELNAGRSDKAAGDLRAQSAAEQEEVLKKDLFGGALKDIIEQDRAVSDIGDEF